jgi:hypothetical protein
MSKSCHVYIMCLADGDGVKGPCKIGITSNLAVRLASLQTASHTKIVFLGSVLLGPRDLARSLEGCVHELLSGKRANGEWFDIEPHEAAGVLVRIARMSFEKLGAAGADLEDLCEKTGATDLQRFFVKVLDRDEASPAN